MPPTPVQPPSAAPGATAPDGKPPMSPLKKCVLGCLLFVLVAFTVVCIVAAVLWRQYHREPAYWEKNQTVIAGQDPAALAEAAEGFERKLVNTTAPAVQGEADEPVRTIHVTCDEINSWIAVKAAAWAAHQNIQLPREIQGTMVAIEDGHLVVAFKIDTPKLQKVVSAPLQIRLLESGQAEVKLLGLRAGDMDVPFWAVPTSLSQNQQSALFFERAQEGIQFTPLRAIDPNRSLRLIGLAVTDDGLDLTVKTEGHAKPKKTAVP